MSDKKETYKRIKIAGLIFFIPFSTAIGPVIGYFVGDYLHKKFHFPLFVVFILIALGAISGFMETTRIIRLMTKIEKEK
jgi:MFS family permease